jgi:hypothetical protein
MASTRLIIVPQYPAPMRYQEWWPQHLRQGYEKHFDEVVLLMPSFDEANSVPFRSELGSFSPAQQSVDWEVKQIEMYNNLALRSNDVLLLCDLSFPGLFASVLFHKRPRHCFAICHATSKNRFDYFAKVRKKGKWRTETGHSQIFDRVFVASNYHKEKLGWSNIDVIKFPLPRVGKLVGYGSSYGFSGDLHQRQFVSVARKGVQKVDVKFQKEISRELNTSIYRTTPRSWDQYYRFLQSGKFLVITSREETYGYQAIDALSVGTCPIAPRSLCYPEILPEDNLYTPGDIESFKRAIDRNRDKPSVPALWSDTFVEDTARKMA